MTPLRFAPVSDKDALSSSPLLFAVAVDILLRRLQRLFPDAFLRAFADDIGAIFSDLPRDAELLMQSFRSFEEISGLALNLSKTITIPLWLDPLQDIKEQLAEKHSAWNLVCVARKGTYLGFAIGPEKGDTSWGKAEDKFLKRAQLWGMQGGGLHVSIYAYNTFAVSVLAFIAQLELPPDHLQATEIKAIRRIATGPGQWIIREDAWFLAEGYGQTKSCTAIHYMAQAAKFRVAHLEKWSQAGGPLRRRVYALKLNLKLTDNVQARHRWSSWYERSHIFQLQDNLDILERQGITYSSITTEILGGRQYDPHAWDEAARDRVKANLQRCAYARIKMKGKPNFEYRLRHKLERWKLEGVEAHVAIAVHRRMNELKKLVAPRVQSAVFSTLWNRWCSPRRFQRRECKENICLLGCGGHAEDSIEHYSFCKAVRAVACTMLRLDQHFIVGKQHFLMADARLKDPEILTCMALLIYAAYNVTNMARQEGPMNAQDAIEALKQSCRNGVRGHSGSTKTLDSRYVNKKARNC